MRCTICDTKIKKGQTACSNCKADANTNEKVLFKSPCDYAKDSPVAKSGYGILTNERLLILSTSNTAMVVGGLVGALLAGGAGKVSLELFLDDIVDVTDGKQALRKTLVVKTKSGDTYKLLSMGALKGWKKAFQDIGKYVDTTTPGKDSSPIKF